MYLHPRPAPPTRRCRHRLTRLDRAGLDNTARTLLPAARAPRQLGHTAARSRSDYLDDDAPDFGSPVPATPVAVDVSFRAGITEAD